MGLDNPDEIQFKVPAGLRGLCARGNRSRTDGDEGAVTAYRYDGRAWVFNLPCPCGCKSLAEYKARKSEIPGREN